MLLQSVTLPFSGQSVMLVQVWMCYVCSESTSVTPTCSASDGAQQGDSLYWSLNQNLLFFFLQFKQAKMINWNMFLLLCVFLLLRWSPLSLYVSLSGRDPHGCASGMQAARLCSAVCWCPERLTWKAAFPMAQLPAADLLLPDKLFSPPCFQCAFSQLLDFIPMPERLQKTTQCFHNFSSMAAIFFLGCLWSMWGSLVCPDRHNEAVGGAAYSCPATGWVSSSSCQPLVAHPAGVMKCTFFTAEKDTL